MSADYDVVIAGGGPVGAALACALSGQGLRLAVIEARAPAAGPQNDVRTLALAYGSRRILEALDLWSALPSTPIRSIHVSEQGGCGVTRLDSGELQVPALGYVVAAADLGRVLQDRARSRPDIDWLCPATIDTVSLHPEAAQIGLQTANGTRLLQARLLVAADGGRSAVRERLGLEVIRRDYHQDAIIANLTLACSHGHVAYERFTPDGPLALLPLEQQRGALVMTVPRTRRDAVLGLDEHAFTERVAAGFGGRLPRITACSARQHYPLQLVQAHQTVRHRAVVIGNAAHTLHPIAGQGFNLGLRDAAVLAELVSDAHDDGIDIGAPEVLQGHGRRRRGDQLRTLGFTDGLATLFTSNLPPLRAARRLGLGLLDLLPPAKRLLARQSMGLRGRLPRLALGLPPADRTP